jgi:hypothetical protein
LHWTLIQRESVINNPKEFSFVYFLQFKISNVSQTWESATYNSSTRENEAGELEVTGQPRLYSEFEASLGYIVKPFLKK